MAVIFKIRQWIPKMEKMAFFARYRFFETGDFPVSEHYGSECHFLTVFVL